MGGRIILFIVICFLAYWAWQYYKNRQQPNQKTNPSGKSSSILHKESNVDELIAAFKSKIVDIESKSIEEIKRSEELLAYYKEELEKLNNLKTL